MWGGVGVYFSRWTDYKRDNPGGKFPVSPSTMTVESKMASSPDLLSYGFSVIVALGGVIGYAKAGWYFFNCFWFPKELIVQIVNKFCKQILLYKSSSS